jgi:putative SOS response-associated peptidase YedK
MCSRYALKASQLAQLCEELGVAFDQAAARDRYNIAPATSITALRPGQSTILHWGLIPHWTQINRRPAAPLINARAETLTAKPSFRDAWRQQQRCVIPVSGFYEWEKRGRERLPWLFQHRDGRPLAFAGLWDRWADPIDDSVIESCTVITTTPNARISRIHDRMPVLLEPAAARQWLTASPDEATDLLRPYPAEQMRETALDPCVNSTARDDEACWTPRGKAPGTQFDLF